MRKVPERMTKILQATIKYQPRALSPLLRLQLSKSHIQPMGWNDINVPKRAPTRETRLLKTGIELAIMYAVMVAPNVQDNHVAQCQKVFDVRCLLPCNRRTKMYLLDS